MEIWHHRLLYGQVFRYPKPSAEAQVWLAEVEEACVYVRRAWKEVKHPIHSQSLDWAANLIHRCLRLEIFRAFGAWVTPMLAFFMLFKVVKITPFT